MHKTFFLLLWQNFGRLFSSRGPIIKVRGLINSVGDGMIRGLADRGGAGLLDVVEAEATVGSVGWIGGALSAVCVHSEQEGLGKTWNYLETCLDGSVSCEDGDSCVG